MPEARKPLGNAPRAAKTPARGVGSEKASKLVAEMLAGKIVLIEPELEFSSAPGFSYPVVERLLGVGGEEAVAILESLVDKGALVREFFDRILRCPHCHSVNLRPSNCCPKCGSRNLARGRVLEHISCRFVGLEDDFVSGDSYICPKCGSELRISGGDYQSLGLMNKCQDCYEIFAQPEIQWRCLKCGALTPQDSINEVNVYSYRFNEARREWLEFEVKPKSQLIEFLRNLGYEVAEDAVVKGRSGAEHKIDILATKDDGIVVHDIAIGIKVAGEDIGLGEVCDFDDKAYDSGIHDKVLVVQPGLRPEAEKFASQQRIKVLKVKGLEAVLAESAAKPVAKVSKEPFEFKSELQLIAYLKRLGYKVREKADVKGRSGATHKIDILATKDDGIVVHDIAIGVEVGKEPIGLEKLFAFDNKAYDIGILDKVFIAVPALAKESRQFAQRQRIKVFEAAELGPSR
ncbi:MAG: restriction endonuclease [Chloroflexi bacterium]|nr:restriction endonuclease [Chloroflexota bacterium]